MATRALFILSDGESVEAPFHDSAALVPYRRNGNVYTVRRVWARSNVVNEETYEIYAEPEITEAQAIARAREWNQRFPDQAVPPVGAML